MMGEMMIFKLMVWMAIIGFLYKFVDKLAIDPLIAKVKNFIRSKRKG